MEELQGTLLPTATLVNETPSNVSNTSAGSPLLTTATLYPIEARTEWNNEGEEAMFIPPEPSDSHYKKGNDVRLAMAQYMGRQEATKEVVNVLRNNDTIPAYNNQINMGLDRANQIAQMENLREQLGGNPKISALSSKADEAAAKAAPKSPASEPYFPKKYNGGYEVKEYQMGEYDGGYKYDMYEYKSDYD